MMTEHSALQIHDFAPVLLHQARLLQELPVILIRDETNLHALGFLRRFQMRFAGNLSGIRLGQSAQRENSSGQLFLL